MATWESVAGLAHAMPETVEDQSGTGTRVWRVRKKMVAWERPLRRSDLEALGVAAPTGPILAVHVADLGMKEALLSADPRVFFTTPHFDGYPAVLVRLPKIGVAQLRGILRDAWLDRAPKSLVAEYLSSKDAKAPRPTTKKKRRA